MFSRWFSTRVISANMVRIHDARGGGAMPSSFSCASTQVCSMHIGLT